MPNRDYNPPIKTCETCGKQFICHDPRHWTYRKYATYEKGRSNIRYFCSWGCMRKWEEERKKE